jgi:multicomponent Na+:H+ antiporter subunit G
MIQFSVVIGLLPRAKGLLVALKLIGVWLLVLLSSARVSQLIGRAARLGKLQK